MITDLRVVEYPDPKEPTDPKRPKMLWDFQVKRDDSDEWEPIRLVVLNQAPEKSSRDTIHEE